MRLVVRAFADVKDNFDSGQFKAIQKAAMYALQHPEITLEIAEKYSRRLDMLSQTLNAVGFRAKKPAALLLPIRPCATRHCRWSAVYERGGFCQYLIREKLICTVPWDEAGPYIRLSVTFEAASLRRKSRWWLRLVDVCRMCSLSFSAA